MPTAWFVRPPLRYATWRWIPRIKNLRVSCKAASCSKYTSRLSSGKYAMRQLVGRLPCDNPRPDFTVSDDTVTAVLATLYEVVRKNMEFAQSLLQTGGVTRLVHVTHNAPKFKLKVVKFAASVSHFCFAFAAVIYSCFTPCGSSKNYIRITRNRVGRNIILTPKEAAPKRVSGVHLAAQTILSIDLAWTLVDLAAKIQHSQSIATMPITEMDTWQHLISSRC